MIGQSKQISQELWFTKPFHVAMREQDLPAPAPNQALVRSLYSGISAGTELLVYRGQVPDSMPLDASLSSLGDGAIKYPLQYGYACVGRVEQVGSGVDDSWIGKTVFSFQPHASHFLSDASELIPVPQDVDPLAAVFLANMETAVNLVQDARPLLGDRIVVLGQGILGLIVSGLLAEFPLAALYSADRMSSRRNKGEEIGVMASFNPDNPAEIETLKTKLQLDQPRGGADIVMELTGAPAALNLAVELSAYSGRIIVGSWYGSKTAALNLGERFHRNRINIVSSQVSSIAPELGGRWNKKRRLTVAWDRIRKLQLEHFISHRLPISEAAEAYRLLDSVSEEALQIIFDYSL